MRQEGQCAGDFLVDGLSLFVLFQLGDDDHGVDHLILGGENRLASLRLSNGEPILPRREAQQFRVRGVSCRGVVGYVVVAVSIPRGALRHQSCEVAIQLLLGVVQRYGGNTHGDARGIHVRQEFGGPRGFAELCCPAVRRLPFSSIHHPSAARGGGERDIAEGVLPYDERRYGGGRGGPGGLHVILPPQVQLSGVCGGSPYGAPARAGVGRGGGSEEEEAGKAGGGEAGHGGGGGKKTVLSNHYERGEGRGSGRDCLGVVKFLANGSPKRRSTGVWNGGVGCYLFVLPHPPCPLLRPRHRSHACLL